MVQRFTFTWSAWSFAGDIQTGDLSTKLLRPCDPAHHYLAEQIGWKLFDLLTVVPLVAVVAWLVPAVQFPLDAARLGALVLALAAGFLISELLGYIFGVISFWTLQSTALYSLVIGSGQFLSGFVAPLDLFPEPLRAATAWLPFRFLIDLPVSILTGRADWPTIGQGLGVAALWIVLFFAIYRLLYTRGLRRYEAVGA
jgi:ABC-2 type transport system permease protein